MDGCLSNMKLHVLRVLVDSDGGNMYSASYVDEVSEHCGVCRACDEAPHVPIAGTSPVLTADEKLLAD